MTTHVYSLGRFVAMIEKQSSCADTFNKTEPWLILHNSGRVDRFANYTEARNEAQKAYPAASFKKGN